jgi:hypothetical protein
MLTRSNRCIQVALGIDAQLVESMRHQAEPATLSVGSIVYFWRLASTNGVAVTK